MAIQSLKTTIRSALEKRGVAYAFNDTLAYAIYLRIMYPREVKARRKQLAFFQRLIGGSSLVFDIGANNGDKARIFSRIAKRLICLEPNPESIARLTERFGGDPRIVIVPQGVSDSSGVGTISVYPGDQSAYSSFSPRWIEEHGAPSRRVEVKLTTLEDLISRFGRPSYIKIDVEGYELNVLRGLRTPVPLISFECNLPVFLSETLECITLLERLSTNCRFNFCASEPAFDFARDGWIDSGEIQAIAASGKFSFMEIFGRSSASS